MKAKELAALLLKHPEVDVKVGFMDDVEGIVYEDDGLQTPRIFVLDRYLYQKYDEDYEHGFKVVN